MKTAVDLSTAWDELHEQPRFRPLYPSEWVVRFGARHLSQRPGQRVLDLGCGAGRHGLLALDHGSEVVAFDLSTGGLRHTRDRFAERPGAVAHTVAGRYEHLPFADGRFDAVICFGVLYYGDASTFAEGVDEIRRILTDGGHALVVLRSTDDHRHGRGLEVEPNTYLLDIPETNEVDMLMHFVDREGLDRAFSGFSNIIVERHDHTANGGAILNSDWIVEATR